MKIRLLLYKEIKWYIHNSIKTIIRHYRLFNRFKHFFTLFSVSLISELCVSDIGHVTLTLFIVELRLHVPH